MTRDEFWAVVEPGEYRTIQIKTRSTPDGQPMTVTRSGIVEFPYTELWMDQFLFILLTTPNRIRGKVSLSKIVDVV